MPFQIGMGLTLNSDDFVEAASSPRLVVLGALLQFTIMPTMAFLMSKLFALPTPLAVGIILVGCCPGGTASNLVTYLAHANVALSVVLTTCSTMLVSLFPLPTDLRKRCLTSLAGIGLNRRQLQRLL